MGEDRRPTEAKMGRRGLCSAPRLRRSQIERHKCESRPNRRNTKKRPASLDGSVLKNRVEVSCIGFFEGRLNGAFRDRVSILQESTQATSL